MVALVRNVNLVVANNLELKPDRTQPIRPNSEELSNGSVNISATTILGAVPATASTGHHRAFTSGLEFLNPEPVTKLTSVYLGSKLSILESPYPGVKSHFQIA